MYRISVFLTDCLPVWMSTWLYFNWLHGPQRISHCGILDIRNNNAFCTSYSEIKDPLLAIDISCFKELMVPADLIISKSAIASDNCFPFCFFSVYLQLHDLVNHDANPSCAITIEPGDERLNLIECIYY